MKFQIVKSLTISLFILNFGLAAFQFFCLIKGMLSLWTAFFMLITPLLLIVCCKKLSSLPELVEIKDFRWHLKGIKNLGWELLLLLLTGLIPLVGTIFTKGLFSSHPDLSASTLVTVLIQGCILLGICWQVILSKDCLMRFMKLTDAFNSKDQSNEAKHLPN